ncbi:hypothetical protein D3C72_1873050 [compost metagenome]
MRGLFPMHHGRAMVAPHGQGHGMAHCVDPAGHALARQAHCVGAAQRSQAQLQGHRAQVVAAGGCILPDQAAALVADEVAVRLGSGHAGCGSQVLESQRAGRIDERLQQRKANLHRLNASAVFVQRVVHCGSLRYSK